MALLYAPGNSTNLPEPILGTTRLEKLAYLAQMEDNLPARYVFEPHDYGPWSPGVVDDADALRGVGLIHINEKPLGLTYQEGDEFVTEGQMPDFDDFTGEHGKKLRIYSLTPKGKVAAEKVWQGLSQEERSGIQSLKNSYNKLPLTELLVHVYKAFPDSASKSKIAASLSKRGTRPWLRVTAHE